MTPAQDLEYRYVLACATASDIVDHLPLLYRLAKGREVVELGTRRGVSTLAFLAARPKALHAWDINRHLEVDLFVWLAKANGIPFTFKQEDSLTCTIPPCDILFIDTLHTYGQLSAELQRHSPMVRQYVACHDTVTYGTRGEAGDPGLLPAIRELVKQGQWEGHLHDPRSNGMTVLRRVQPAI